MSENTGRCSLKCVWELLQLFIQIAQESPSFCHGIAQAATIQQIWFRGTHNVTDDVTLRDQYTKHERCHWPAASAHWYVMLLSVWTVVPSWSHPIHSNSHGDLISAPQLLSDGVFSNPVTARGLLAALLRKQSEWTVDWRWKVAWGVSWHGFFGARIWPCSLK